SQEASAGEDPRSNHVGDNQRCRAEQAQLAEKSGFSGGHYIYSTGRAWFRVTRAASRAVTFLVFLPAAARAGIVAATFDRRRRVWTGLCLMFWLLRPFGGGENGIQSRQPQPLVQREHHQLRLA